MQLFGGVQICAEISGSLLENPRLEEQMENLQQLALHSWWGGGEVERLRQTQGEGEREKEAFLRCPMDYAHPVLTKLQLH